MSERAIPHVAMLCDSKLALGKQGFPVALAPHARSDLQIKHLLQISRGITVPDFYWPYIPDALVLS